ncbi:MAG: hypothetical protein ACTSYJ_10715, partial [Candidatus Thorarchaeota archaeon]
MGILGNFPLKMARDLLLLLTHRGQDAAGLLWSDEKSIKTSKAMGNPGKIKVPESSPMHILGSTRYPTTGKRVASSDDLDTFVGPFNLDDISMTHNGNITNMASVSDRQVDCDSEFIAERLSIHLKANGGNLPDAFKKLEKEVDGSFSLTGLYQEKLFAYRDSHGFKPLVFGRTKKNTIVASESQVLD